MAESKTPIGDDSWPEDIGSFDVGDPALAKEIERRWNNFQPLMIALKEYFRELDALIKDHAMIGMRRSQLRAAYRKAEWKNG